MALPGVATGMSMVGRAREALAYEIQHLLIGDHEPVLQRRGPVDDDPGLFGPDSVTWRMHTDFCMLVGGLRALMLQTMHPLAMAGVAEHSNYKDDPLSRLANTAIYVGSTIYGDTDQAERAVKTVKRVHETVVGIASDGRPYAANDPHLLTFVHHTLVDSFLRAYMRYGSEKLSPDEADQYVEEMAVLMELFEGEPAARSFDELRQYFRDLRPELRATSDARDTMRFLLLPPLPMHARAPYGVMCAAAVGMLPGSVRRELWVPLPPAVEPLMVRPATKVLLRSLDWVTDAVRVDAA